MKRVTTSSATDTFLQDNHCTQVYVSASAAIGVGYVANHAASLAICQPAAHLTAVDHCRSEADFVDGMPPAEPPDSRRLSSVDGSDICPEMAWGSGSPCCAANGVAMTATYTSHQRWYPQDMIDPDASGC
jgi:hypothetical protein